jgi:elongator complex protein 3
MPGLPFSTPEKDIQTYREICENPDFCPDLVKIYPCSVVPFSELEHWYRKGEYIPYSDDVLFELLKEMKQITPPWMRISRLVRDIPGTAILGGSKNDQSSPIDPRADASRGETVSVYPLSGSAR